MKDQQKVTVYSSGEFLGSINKYEGRLIDCGYKEYAQYKNAPFVTFIPAKKRNPVGIIKGYKPYIVVLKGTGHPEPNEVFTKVISDTGGATMKQSTYSSFDERWKTDFDKILDPYLESHKDAVILDARNTKQA